MCIRDRNRSYAIMPEENDASAAGKRYHHGLDEYDGTSRYRDDRK